MDNLEQLKDYYKVQESTLDELTGFIKGFESPELPSEEDYLTPVSMMEFTNKILGKCREFEANSSKCSVTFMELRKILMELRGLSIDMPPGQFAEFNGLIGRFENLEKLFQMLVSQYKDRREYLTAFNASIRSSFSKINLSVR